MNNASERNLEPADLASLRKAAIRRMRGAFAHLGRLD